MHRATPTIPCVSEDLGRGVELFACSFSTTLDCPENKLLFKVVIKLKHFTAIADMECFSTEMNDDASDDEKKSFMADSIAKFKKNKYSIIKQVVTSLPHETYMVFQSMMDEIISLHKTVGRLEDRIEDMKSGQ